MENFKEGYWWFRHIESGDSYIDYVDEDTKMNSNTHELMQYLGKDYSEFQQLFKIKAS